MNAAMVANVATPSLWQQELPAAFQAELRVEGGAAVLFLLEQALATIKDEASADAKRYIEEAYDRAWERLHCGSWKSIHRVWRQAFGFASVLKAQSLAHEGRLKESLKALDMCLMMAGPYAPPRVHTMIDAVSEAIHRAENAEQRASLPSPKRRRLMTSQPRSVVDSVPSLRFPIKRIHMPSLEMFSASFMKTDTPVIITGAMDAWPAMGKEDRHRSWHTLEYFRRVAGHRTVPIEVGSSYLEDDWSQQLMTLNEFINRFLERQDSSNAGQSNDSPQTIGYLAQHHLFEQIPALGRDIMTPDYCTLERDDGGDDDVAVNAWFGPKGTVSPLHFDPKDNLLCQVVGKKYLRLFAPSESEKLYPVEGLLSNTSQVRVEDPDLLEFPLFAEATYIDCVLQEGEMLYIPPRYWHFVRSLSTSFSVSFWWS